MQSNSNNGSSNELLSNLNTEHQIVNFASVDVNLPFKKFVAAFANQYLTAPVNSDKSGLGNNNYIKPRQILSRLRNYPDLVNLLNKVKSTLPAEHQDLNALYELNARANNFIDHDGTHDYSNTIHSVIVNLNSMKITPLQRIEVFYLVLFHNFNGEIITDSEIETKNSQGGYKTPLSRYKPSLANFLRIYNDDGNEILKMSDYTDTNWHINLLKREEDIKNMKDKNHVFIARGYTSLPEIFLGYLPEIKDYHEFIWEALDMLGDGVIDNCITPATFVGMDGLLEKVVLDSEFGKRIIKQFYRFTKTNEATGDLKYVNTELDKFIDLLKKITEPQKRRQDENIVSYVYDKLNCLCNYLGHPEENHNFYPMYYEEATAGLLDSGKLHVWLHIKSFFCWIFNKKTYDETYNETVVYELKKCFCKVCRKEFSDYKSWLMRTHLEYNIKNHADLNVITNEKEPSSDRNKINEGNRQLEPKLADPKDSSQPKQNL